ncbi:hypothetical protein [Enterobacter cloacae complex sp. 409J2]|uniref:hypothetical protein n=1 Tax=unclassified Enterobacter cloacae complex TaxID=2757714 RepID=UPI003CF08E2F
MTFTKEQLIAAAVGRIEMAEETLANDLVPLARHTFEIDLELARIALASLEAEPAIHRWRRVTAEPYGPYPWHYGNFIGFSKPVDGIEDEYYYAAPPAPVSVPAAMEMDDDFDSAFEHGKAVGWNAYRAAMLQGADGNSPAIPDGWTGSDEANAALIMLDRIETVDSVDDDRIEGIKRIIRALAAAPKQEVK